MTKSIEKTDGQIKTRPQILMLGRLKIANVDASIRSMIYSSAENIVNNAESFVKRAAELGYTTPDGKPLNITVDTLTEGVDLKKRSSIAKALQKNEVLRNVAIADATGHILIDSKLAAENIMRGNQVQSQNELNSIINSLSAEELSAVGDALGIEDWSTVTYQSLRNLIDNYNSSGKAQNYINAKQAIDISEQIKSSPKTAVSSLKGLKDGEAYKLSSKGKNLAVSKINGSYYVYDYDTKDISKPLSYEQAERVISPEIAKRKAEQKQKAQAVEKKSAKEQARLTQEENKKSARNKRKSKEKAISQEERLKKEQIKKEQKEEKIQKFKDNLSEIRKYATENVKNFNALSEPNKLMIEKVIREARSNGFSESDVKLIANVSAKTGFDITFESNDMFNEDAYILGNTIYINPNVKTQRLPSKLLIHELGHSLLRLRGGKKLFKEAVKKLSKTKQEEIATKYGMFYESLGYNAQQYSPIINEEITTAYIEDILGNKNALNYMIDKKPDIKERILNFFDKSAKDYSKSNKMTKSAKKLYKTYEKLFNKLSEINQQRNVIQTNDSTSKKYSLGKGYYGYSMSNNAISAYEAGEKRLAPNEFGGYDIEEWDGNKFVKTSYFKDNIADKRFSLSSIKFSDNDTRSGIVKDIEQEYKPNIKERISDAITSSQVRFTNAQAGIEKFGKNLGIDDIDVKVQTVRASTAEAENMIGDSQYSIGSDNKYLGKGLAKIFEPIYKGEKKNPSYRIDFYDYLFHQHNKDRMTLEERFNGEYNENERKLKIVEDDIKKIERKITKAKDNIKYFNRVLKTKEVKENAKKSEQITKKLQSERKNLSSFEKTKSELSATKNGLNKFFQTHKKMENKPVLRTIDESGNEIPVTAEQSAEIISSYESKYPEFKAIAQEVWDFNRNLNQYRVDTGLITQEAFDIMQKMYPHYVPTYREDSNKGIAAIKGKYGIEVKQTVKRAKGSTKTLLPPDVIISRQVMETVRAGRINQLANELFLNRKTAIDENGANVETLNPDELVDLDPTDLRPKNNQITFFSNGKKYTLKVGGDVFKGFEAFNPNIDISNFIVKSFAYVNDKFKKLVTAFNPTFGIRNSIRDIQAAGINSKYPKVYLKNYKKAINEFLKNGEMFKLYRARGGFSSSVFDFDKGYINSTNKWGLTKEEGKLLKKGLAYANNMNTFLEQVPRLAEFISSIEAGNSVEQAILDSADVTVNFGRSGTITRVLNRTVIPFLNPSIQGISKMIRNVTSIRTAKEFATLAFKVAIVGIAPQIINMLMYGDDEDYNDLRPTDKENNFLFKVGDTFIKLPRDRIASAVGGVFNRLSLQAKGENADWVGYLKNVWQQNSPIQNFARPIWAPIQDVANNRTWYGTEIEGQQFDNTRPKDRYDESTSSIAIALAKVFPLSPKKINYLIDQYSGVIGDFIIPATSQKAQKGIISGNFTIDPVLSNKQSSDFYKLYDEAQYNKTDKDEVAIYQVKYLNRVKDAISKMYDEKSEIQKSDLSATEKLQQTRVIQALINEAYKTAITDYEAFTEAVKSTDYIPDETLRYIESTRLVYGAKQALYVYDEKVFEKSEVLYNAGVDYNTFYNFYFGTKGITSDVTEDGETISGSKKQKILQYINSMDIPTEQKLIILTSAGYSIGDNEIDKLSASKARNMLLSYILNLKNVTKEQKEEIAQKCGFKVKNGKIMLN